MLSKTILYRYKRLIVIKLNSIPVLIKNEFSYLKYKLLGNFKNNHLKSLNINFSSIEINRYLYTFLKNFQEQDYSIFVPPSRQLISRLNKKNGDLKYANRILNLNIFFKRISENATINIPRFYLSNDYYSTIHDNKENEYHVPIGLHPDILFGEIEKFKKNTRKKSIVFIGNIDGAYYNQISKSIFFDISSRFEAYSMVYQHHFFLRLKSSLELHDFLISSRDNRVVIVDTYSDFRLSKNDYLEVLSSFDFFLALPGIQIPESHNLYESLSLGCIPIIEESYANLLRPKLEPDVNCIIFKSLNDLNNVLTSVLNLNENKKFAMRQAVLNYVERNIKPEGIIENICSKKIDKIYVQAEHHSLKLYSNCLPINK